MVITADKRDLLLEVVAAIMWVISIISLNLDLDIGDTCHGVNDDDKIYYVNSNKDMALALSSDMDDL